MNRKTILLAVLATNLLLFSCKKEETITPAPPVTPHTVTAISPTTGPKNTVVTITGTNFGTSAAALKVLFNGVQGTIQSVTDVQITATVPAGASTGVVKVEKNGTQISGPSFTYEGNGTVMTFTLSGPASGLNHPSGIVKDAAGNFFVCDRDNHRILKITPAGVSTVFAGGTMGGNNGTGTAAQFNQPYSITIDGAGNLYVGDRMNHMIRKITPAGVVSYLAGNGSGGFANGTGAAAMFNEPLGVAADAAGNVYVADYINSSLRKVTPAGVVTTLASVTNIFGVAVDAAGNIYCAEYGNQQVSKYSSSGAYSVIAGQSGSTGQTDGTGSAARFNFPAGIVVDASGNLYVSEIFNHRIRKITSAGVVTTIAGNAQGYADGIGAAASFDFPIAVTPDFANGFLYIADFNNNKIRKMIIE